MLADEYSKKPALLAFDISRATYYRWNKNYEKMCLTGREDKSKRRNNIRKSTSTSNVEQQLYLLRKKIPLWGKSKIAAMYKREFNQAISASTVGRILKKLLKQNKIMPVRFLYGKKDKKKNI